MSNSNEKAKQIEDLLVLASKAHHVFETEVLKGVYDQEWPLWYAKWAVEHDLNKLVSKSHTAEEWGKILSLVADKHKQTSADQPWAAFYGHEIAAQFG